MLNILHWLEFWLSQAFKNIKSMVDCQKSLFNQIIYPKINTYLYLPIKLITLLFHNYKSKNVLISSHSQFTT